MKQKLIKGQMVKAVLDDGKVVSAQFVEKITKVDRGLLGSIHSLFLIEVHGPTRYEGTWAVTENQLL
jgi:hypothetical protein